MQAITKSIAPRNFRMLLLQVFVRKIPAFSIALGNFYRLLSHFPVGLVILAKSAGSASSRLSIRSISFWTALEDSGVTEYWQQSRNFSIKLSRDIGLQASPSGKRMCASSDLPSFVPTRT